MDLPLRTISYIADIGNMVVLMARGKMVRSRSAQDNLDHATEQTTMTHDDRRLYRMICHVFESEDVSSFFYFYYPLVSNQIKPVSKTGNNCNSADLQTVSSPVGVYWGLLGLLGW